MSKTAMPATVRMPIPERFKANQDRATIELPVGRLPSSRSSSKKTSSTGGGGSRG